MKRKLTLVNALLGVSPYLILGMVLILVPIFIFITIDNIKALNQRVTEHFTGRGEALIRSLEAGTRTGMMVMRWEVGKIQRLLAETTLQSDIEYIMITDGKGKILAHSDPEKVGQTCGQLPLLPDKNKPSQVQYREVVDENDKRIFEVFKRFTPVRPRHPGQHLKKMLERLPPLEPKYLPDNWCNMHFFIDRGKGYPEIDQFIYEPGRRRQKGSYQTVRYDGRCPVSLRMCRNDQPFHPSSLSFSPAVPDKNESFLRRGYGQYARRAGNN